MSVLGGTSILREFLEFIAARARAFPYPSGGMTGADLRHELDSFVALGLAAYEELGELTREATAQALDSEESELVIAGVREAHARYLEACQPVLRLIQQARPIGAEPKRLDQFMATVGEANLIAHRYDQVVNSQQEADEGRTRTMKEVQDELRRRVHPGGG